MAQIVQRPRKNGEMSYLIRVSLGYVSRRKQRTRSMTWRPEPGMSAKQQLRRVRQVAQDFERRLQGRTNDGTMRLAEFCRDYLSVKQSLFSPTVYGYYERVIEEMIVPVLGHLRLRDIRPAHVQSFIGYLQSRPCRDDPEKRLTGASVHRYFTVLKSIMAMAYRLEYCQDNPTLSGKLTLPPMNEQEVAVFSETEVTALLTALEAEPLMWRLLINLAVVTGARRGELCAFRWENVDMQRGTVRIVASNYRVCSGVVKTKAPKTPKSIRAVSFDPYCGDLLKQWRAEQERMRLEAGGLWQEGGWIFCRSDGRPMDPVAASNWFRLFQKRHGFTVHKFHSLRHTSGTMLLLRGTNIKTVASRLGHTQLSTVNRYVHALEQADVAAANTFSLLRQDTNNAQKSEPPA